LYFITIPKLLQIPHLNTHSDFSCDNFPDISLISSLATTLNSLSEWDYQNPTILLIVMRSFMRLSNVRKSDRCKIGEKRNKDKIYKPAKNCSVRPPINIYTWKMSHEKNIRGMFCEGSECLRMVVKRSPSCDLFPVKIRALGELVVRTTATVEIYRSMRRSFQRCP